MPDKIESWSHDLVQNYVEKIHKSCAEFDVKPPFEFEEFKTLVFNSGIISSFLMQLIGNSAGSPTSKSPLFKTCLRWLLLKSLQLTPELFE